VHPDRLPALRPPGLRVATRGVGWRTVIEVAGEIDIATAPALLDAIRSAGAEPTVEIWVDLSATDFMDSAGLNALTRARTELRDRGRRLAIICPGGPVRRAFEIAGLVDILPVFRSRVGANQRS
jgi:anti-sigma B factor antagonist